MNWDLKKSGLDRTALAYIIDLLQTKEHLGHISWSRFLSIYFLSPNLPFISGEEGKGKMKKLLCQCHYENAGPACFKWRNENMYVRHLCKDKMRLSSFWNIVVYCGAAVPLYILNRIWHEKAMHSSESCCNSQSGYFLLPQRKKCITSKLVKS